MCTAYPQVTVTTDRAAENFSKVSHVYVGGCVYGCVYGCVRGCVHGCVGGYCVVFWGVFGGVSKNKRSHKYVSKSCV